MFDRLTLIACWRSHFSKWGKYIGKMCKNSHVWHSALLQDAQFMKLFLAFRIVQRDTLSSVPFDPLVVAIRYLFTLSKFSYKKFLFIVFLSSTLSQFCSTVCYVFGQLEPAKIVWHHALQLTIKLTIDVFSKSGGDPLPDEFTENSSQDEQIPEKRENCSLRTKMRKQDGTLR